MAWRFLVDEDTDSDTAAELARRGYDAVTVEATLGKGEPDHRVAAFARNEERTLITTDRGFLDPEHRGGIRVMMVADDAASGDEIAANAAELARMADSPGELNPVTWI